MFIPQQTCRCPLLLSSGLGTEGTGETWTLGSSCYSRLGGGWGRVNTRSRIVQGTHAVTKEKSREWGGGVGSPQRWPVPPEARRRLPGKSAPEGQSGGKEQAGQRESSLCRARWYEAASSVPIDGANVAQPPLLGCFSGSPWLPFPGSKALLGHTHTTPLNFCPELLTPRGLWLESPADAPVGCGLRNLMTSRVWGLHADLTVIPPG